MSTQINPNIIAGAAIATAVAYVIYKLPSPKAAIIDTGKLIGVPETSRDKCADAIKRGDNWAASLYCPAGTFIDWELSRVKKKIEDILK